MHAKNHHGHRGHALAKSHHTAQNPDGAVPEGDEPSGVAGAGDGQRVGAAPDGGEPGGDAPSPGAGGLTPPG